MNRERFRQRVAPAACGPCVSISAFLACSLPQPIYTRCSSKILTDLSCPSFSAATTKPAVPRVSSIRPITATASSVRAPGTTATTAVRKPSTVAAGTNSATRAPLSSRSVSVTSAPPTTRPAATKSAATGTTATSTMASRRYVIRLGGWRSIRADINDSLSQHLDVTALVDSAPERLDDDDGGPQGRSAFCHYRRPCLDNGLSPCLCCLLHHERRSPHRNHCRRGRRHQARPLCHGLRHFLLVQGCL